MGSYSSSSSSSSSSSFLATLKARRVAPVRAEVAAPMRRAGPRLAGASVGRMRDAVSSSSLASD